MPTKGPAGPGSPYPPLSPFLPFSPGKPLSPYTLTTNSRLDIPTQIYMFTFKSNCMIWLICDHVHLSQCSYRQMDKNNKQIRFCHSLWTAGAFYSCSSYILAYYRMTATFTQVVSLSESLCPFDIRE